uniref:Ankyrin-2 n=2 Tax=Lygus hesperus TaxID=30085 RepID=A0A0A9Y3T9_LYGHE
MPTVENIMESEKEADSATPAPAVNGTDTLQKPTKQSDPGTSFLRGARAGQLDKVLLLVEQGVDINTCNANGLNALHLAAKDGHVEIVQELLNRGCTVDAATKKGNTALHIAALAGQEEVARLLVDKGANVNVQSLNGFTPLYMAAQENHDAVVKFLLNKGANQTLATEDGFTPLAVAMQQGHDKVVAVLLENDTRGKVRLPALHIAAKKDDTKAATLLLQNDHNPDVTSKSGFTPLHIAAHYGNQNIAALLHQKGADINFAAKHNITPLHVACKWGKMAMVSLLLDKGANIEAKTRDGLTPLHCAARSGHDQVVDLLVENRAPLTSKTKNGLSALHMAAQGDHVDAARILLYHGAPVDDITVDYLTALHVAAHCGHVAVARLLLDRKADPNARALNGFTPLHIACKKNRIKVVELLLKYGASIESTTESGLTPLHVSCFMGCMTIALCLLQKGASPDASTVRGETPLHLAARANQSDIVRVLLRHNATVDAKAREEQTPLHVASRLGNADIAMLLLQHGASPHSTTRDLYTPLHIAAKEGQEEVASVLLENGASLEATTKKGFTPLHLAAKYGNIKVAKLLLQRDAPVDAQGKNGVTPLHVASHYDNQTVALLLLEKGASPHATAKNGHTPLHIAAKKNQMDIATTLLEYGAKANAESKAGFTPLHLAAQEGHTDMTSLLIEHQADVNHHSKNGLTPLHLCAQEDKVKVAEILRKNNAEIDSLTKAGYTPLHIACHFGQVGMVRWLLEQGANVESSTVLGYTPLHQAAQQGHCLVITLLLHARAKPDVVTNQGLTPLAIASKLGYITVVETLKVVTETTVTTTTIVTTEEKYRVVAPESMQETFMSDSEDDGGEDPMLSDQQQYRYMTVDDMKSLGDDSVKIDVTRDEHDYSRDSLGPLGEISHRRDHFLLNSSQPDNVDIIKTPVHVGKGSWTNFLVSFLVDARGGAMRGCRHSGVNVVVPPRAAAAPIRLTCRYLRNRNIVPPLSEAQSLATRVLELSPAGTKFLGPIIIEVPHFVSLRGKERELVIMRSDNGVAWKEHSLEDSQNAVQHVLNSSFEGGDDLDEAHANRVTRVVTTELPQYLAVVSRLRQEVHVIGPEGGCVSSSAVPQVQAIFPPNALTKKIRVGLQAQPISSELVTRLFGNRVGISPIVTVEPRRRKFHKPITLTLPVPTAANKGMINQYNGEAPTLRLLCSITGGNAKAQWEDVTGSTPLTFVKDCVSFTTTVSARFWLMDCRNVGNATNMASQLYNEASHVPFMAKFVVYAKRVDPLEARLRIFVMTDDREDKTLEHQENFTEVAKSRDVEVLEGKPIYLEFAGNLIPVTKSGEQPTVNFTAFRENRLPFTVRLRDPDDKPVARLLFMSQPKVARGEPLQSAVCTLNIALPETIIKDGTPYGSDLYLSDRSYSLPRNMTPVPLSLPRMSKRNSFVAETMIRGNMVLADLCQVLGDDWEPLASKLGVSDQDIEIIKQEVHTSPQRTSLAIKLWQTNQGPQATGNKLEKALRDIGREDVIKKCVRDVHVVTDDLEKAYASVTLDQSGFDALTSELGKDSVVSDSFHQTQESGFLDEVSNSSTTGHLNSEPFDKYAGEEKKIVADFISHECQNADVEIKSSSNGWDHSNQKKPDNLAKQEWKDDQQSIWRSPSLDGLHDGGPLSSDSENGLLGEDNSSTRRKARRAAGSSSGSDVALHEGNDLSDSDPGSDFIQESLSNIGSQVDMHRMLTSP